MILLFLTTVGEIITLRKPTALKNRSIINSAQYIQLADLTIFSHGKTN